MKALLTRDSMDIKTIFSKTAKGLREATGDTSLLHRALRNILKEVDGKRSIAVLQDKLPKHSVNELSQILARLVSEGYIRETVHLEQRVPPARKPISDDDASNDLDFTSFAKPAKPVLTSIKAANNETLRLAEVEAKAKTEAQIQAKKLVEKLARQKDEAQALREVEERVKREAEEKALKTAELQAEAKRKVDEAIRIEQESRTRKEAAEKAKREEEEKAKQSALLKAKQEAEALAHQQAIETARRKAEAVALKEAQEAARLAAEEKLRQEAEEKARLDAEVQARRVAEQKAKQEAEELARQQAEAQMKREVEEAAQREAESRAIAKEAARLASEEKVKREAEEQARLQAEAEAARLAEEKARHEAEALALQKAAEAAALAKREIEEQARKEAEAAAQREAEEKTRLEAEAKTRREAEEKARQEAEVQTRKQAEENARCEAEARALKQAEEKARIEAEEAEEKARQAEAERAEAQARLEAEALAEQEVAEAARLQAELLAKKENEENARLEAERDERKKIAEAEEAIKAEAEAQSWRETLERARLEAEEKARQEDEARIALEAAEKAKREAELLARKETEDRERREAEEKARINADAQSKRDAEEQEQREAELQERLAAKNKLRRELEQIAKADTEERAKREAEKRQIEEIAKRQTRQLARHTSEQARAAKVARLGRLGGDDSINWKKIIVCFSIALLSIGIGFVHVISFDEKIPEFERMAGLQFHQPVKIDTIHMSLFPQPHWRVEGVSVGSNAEITAKQVDAVIELDAMFGDQPTFKSLNADTVVIKEEGLSWLMFGKSHEKSFWFRQITAGNVQFVSKNVTVPAFNIDAVIGADSQWHKLEAEATDQSLFVNMRAEGDQINFDSHSPSFAVPFGSGVVIDGFTAKGTARTNELVLTEFQGGLYRGALSGNAKLKWGPIWSLEGTLDAKQVDAGKAFPALFSRGKIEGHATYSARASEGKSLLAAPHLDGGFVMKDGVLEGIDLMHLLQNSSNTGKTSFLNLEGGFVQEGRRTQIRQMKLGAGILSAYGSAEVDANERINGRLTASYKFDAQRASTNVSISGNLNSPKFGP